MKRLFREIFPINREEWRSYFDWCINHSKVFYPIGRLLNIFAAVILVIVEILIHILLILLFPLTRIELRICANKDRKQRSKNHD